MNATWAWLIMLRATGLQILGAPGLWAMVATCVFSSFVSIFHNHNAHLEALGHYTLELQERQRIRFQSTVGPSGRETDRSLRVLRPPSAAATFVVGVERTLPAGWDFGPAGVETLAPYASQEPLAAFDILADGESVVRLFGGLLAIVLGFWTVTRSPASGWLAAAPWLVPHWWLMSVLLTAGAAVFGLIALLWIGASVMFALWLSDPAAHNAIVFMDSWLLAWIYFVTMFGIGAVIARLSTNSLAGMTTVVATWTVLIFLGPQLLATVVRMASATPTRAMLEQDRREKYADQQKTADDALATSLSAFSPTGLTRPDLNKMLTDAFQRFEPEWRHRMREAREDSDKSNRRWLDARAQWIGRLQTIARFTPGTLLQSGLATANGQSWATSRLWEESISSHESALNRSLFDDRGTLPLRIRWNNSMTLWTKVWHATRSHAELPQFDVVSTSTALDRTALPLDLAAGLLQVVIVFLAAAYEPSRL